MKPERGSDNAVLFRTALAKKGAWIFELVLLPRVSVRANKVLRYGLCIPSIYLYGMINYTVY
jgi:hypothetical protein